MRGFHALEGQADALYVVQRQIEINVSRIVTLALGAQFRRRASLRIGQGRGSSVDGRDHPAMFRRAADYVNRLAGTRPGDLPVAMHQIDRGYQPDNGVKALGLTIPHNLLVLAEEVIE